MVTAEMPKTIEEALEILSRQKHTLFAGGTDLMVQRRSWAGLPRKFQLPIMFLNQIEGLSEIHDHDGYIKIGATCTLERILEYPNTPRILKEIILEMASPAIRHQGTLAGNIANASPAGDSLVGLYLYDSQVVLESLREERIVAIRDFITGPRKTILADDEMIVAIKVPKHDFQIEKYVKVGPRKSDAIAKVAFAGGVDIEEDVIKDIRLVFGAVYKTVLRSLEIEATLKGLQKKELKRCLDSILMSYRGLLSPIDDQRSTSSYRLQVALNLLRGFIEDIE